MSIPLYATLLLFAHVEVFPYERNPPVKLLG